MVYFSSTLTWQVDVGKDVSLSQTRAAICVPCCWVCLFARICGQEWSDLRHCNIFHHSSLCWQECFQSSIELSSSLSITLPLCWQVVVKVTGITLITLRCRVLSSCDLGSSWNRSKHLPIFQCCTPKGGSSDNQTKKYDNNYDENYDNFLDEDLISLDVELTRKPIYKLWLVPSKESHLGSSTYFISISMDYHPKEI